MKFEITRVCTSIQSVHRTDPDWRRGLEQGEMGLGCSVCPCQWLLCHLGRAGEAPGSQVMISVPRCGKQPDPNHIHQSEAFQALVPVLWFHDSIIYD